MTEGTIDEISFYSVLILRTGIFKQGFIIFANKREVYVVKSTHTFTVETNITDIDWLEMEAYVCETPIQC